MLKYLAIFLIFSTAYAQHYLYLSGRARAIDGDTLVINNNSLRLVGIDAPELDQSCQDSQGALWRCGEFARKRLNELLSASEIFCTIQGEDRYRRYLAICYAGNIDINREMVRSGAAISYRDRRYQQEEMEAREARRGIWSGHFDRPEDWRRARRPSPTNTR